MTGFPPTSRFPSISIASGNRGHILARILQLRLVAALVAGVSLWIYGHYLERELDFPRLYGLVIAAVVFALATRVRLQRSFPVTDLELFGHLLVDGALLVTLVALSGRATNPFIYYLLVLVGISATLFPRRVTWAYTGLGMTAYSALLYADLEGHAHHLFSDFQLHLVGMWLNFVASAALLNFFVSTLANALRDREVQLAQAREETLRNEQMVGIGTLAASTVHALGTPLSTMAMVVEELQADLPEQRETCQLLLQQVARCKQTMGKLSLLAEHQETVDRPVTIGRLIETLREHYLLSNPGVMPVFHSPEDGDQQELEQGLILSYALINLIDNAVNAASSRVAVTAVIAPGWLELTIEDDGPGLPAEILKNFGRPSVYRSSGGLGIGTFLANTTIEKLGGTLRVINGDPQRGQLTCVLARLPLAESAAQDHRAVTDTQQTAGDPDHE